MNWPHAPAHWLFDSGIYMVTASTYRKTLFFNTPQRLDDLQGTLFDLAAEFGWSLQAWALFAGHYHFVGRSPDDPASLRPMLTKLHANTARQLNREDGAAGRRVWFQFWDTLITFQASYLARLQYVHQNPVKHGVVDNAENYAWCSAGWFARSAPRAFVRSVCRFKTDRVNVPDDF